MQKTLFLTFIIFNCCFISCNNKTRVASSSETAMANKNKEASQAISKAFETGDVNQLDSVVADDFVDHTERGDIRGRDSLVSMIKMVRKTNRDMKMEIVREVADDEYVFSWMHFTGISDGTMMPTGPYDMKSIELTKFRDGKAVEHWSFMEPREMMKMMGNMPAMNNNNVSKSDTAHMKK